MQGVCDAVADRVMCGRQRLSQHLATKYLGASNVTAFTAIDIVFNALKPEQMQQVFEYRVHQRRILLLEVSPAAIDDYPGSIDENGIIGCEKQCHFADIHGLADTPGRGAAYAIVAKIG